MIENTISNEYYKLVNLFYPNILNTKSKSSNVSFKLYFEFLLNTVERAIMDFKNNNVLLFDALVGENSCQLRAYINWLILSKHKEEINNKFNSLLIKVNHIKSNSTLLNKIETMQNQFKTIKEILTLLDLDIQVSYFEYFLITCWILTFVKEQYSNENSYVIREFSDYNKLQSIKDVKSKSYYTKFTKHCKKISSELSVFFIFDISSNENTIYEYSTLKQLLFVDPNTGLHCLPCYLSSDILFNQYKKHKVPIIIIYEIFEKQKINNQIKSKTIFKFNYNNSINKYEAVKIIHSNDLNKDYQLYYYNKNNKDINEPSVIIQSQAYIDSYNENIKQQLINKILSYDIIELLLITMALDKQYFVDNINQDKINSLNDQKYNKYKSLTEIGCDIIDPHFFFPTHLYCDLNNL